MSRSYRKSSHEYGVAGWRDLLHRVAGPAVFAVTMMCLAPLLGRQFALQAQTSTQCSTLEPKCDPPQSFVIDISIAGGDTVYIADPRISVVVHGLAYPSGPGLSISTIGPVPLVLESNGQTASGTGKLALAAGLNAITVTYCDGTNGCAPGVSRNVFYVAPPNPVAHGAPIVAQETGAHSRRSLAECSGCAYATLSYDTPPYRSLDEDRSLTLLYSSATSAPMGTVVLDVNANSDSVPDKMSVSLLQQPGNVPVQLSDGQYELFYEGGFGVSRITAQFDARDYGTSYYPMTAVVRNWWGTTWKETRLDVNVMILKERDGDFGSGWSVAGMQLLRLPQGLYGPVMITENGRSILFPNCGMACWDAPLDEPSTFVRLASGMYERRYKNGDVVTFEQNFGLMVSQRNRFGLQTTFQYDSYLRLSQITDPAGIVTSIAWTGPPGVARTASITAPSSGGGTTQVNLSAAGELVSIIDPDNVTALSVVYSGNRIASATNRLGGTTTFTYDAYGALASVVAPSRVTTDQGTVSPVTTIRSREAALLPAAGTGTAASPAPRVVPGADWLAMRSPRGDSTRMTANGAGNPMAIVTRNPQGKLESTEIGYDPWGRVKTVTSTNGASVAYEWNGPLVAQIRDLTTGVTTSYSYNTLGQLWMTYLDGTLQETNYYSPDTRSVLDSTTSGNSTARFTYDAIGRLLTARDGEQHQTSFAYQTGSFQNVQSTTRNGHTTQVAYDGYGRPQAITDATGRVQTTGYDLLNRVTSVTAPDLSVSSWSYNDATRQYTFTDARSQTYQSVLDAAGLTRWSYDPSSGTPAMFSYDADGNLASSTSKGGRTVTLTRDVPGRVTQITAGSLVTMIAYDTASKWTAYANAESIDTIFVDGKGRVTKQVTVRGGTPVTTTADYGENGTRNALHVASPSWGVRDLGFGTDAIGRPDVLTDFAGNPTSITYNPDSRPQTITLPTSTTPNARLRQTSATGRTIFRRR